MAGEVTEAVKASVGCLFWIAVISVALTIGYFVLNIILYLIPVILAIAIGLAVLQLYSNHTDLERICRSLFVLCLFSVWESLRYKYLSSIG